MGSLFSFDIIHTISPQKDDIPCLDTHNGKGDHVTHLLTFQVLCSDYDDDHRILTKLFYCTLHDKYLQWYFSFPPYSIESFYKLSNSFIQKK